jgi:hypothetical protein
MSRGPGAARVASGRRVHALGVESCGKWKGSTPRVPRLSRITPAAIRSVLAKGDSYSYGSNPSTLEGSTLRPGVVNSQMR